MLDSYPWACRQAVAEIEKNPFSTQLAVLFRDFWVDSNLEGLYWLRMSAHASPHWLAPLACNFRAHPIVCPRTAVMWGDLPHPCLLTEKPFRAVWFPQVTLLLDGHRHRPDCLVCRGGQWTVIQVDGKGHNPGRDKQLDHDLGLPVLRLKTGDVFSADLWALLAAKIV